MRQLLRTTATVFVALVFTAGMAFGQDSDATVTQNANDSEATIEQTNNSDRSLTGSINQSGDNHEATITQTIKGDGPSASASVEQSGSEAFAEVIQNLDNSGKDVTATVTQDGLNDAFVTQGSNMSNSRVDLTQTYKGSMARGEGDDRNLAEINQKSGGSRVIASQTGVSNEMFVDQLPLVNNVASELIQDGDNNLIDLNQGNRSFDPTRSSEADILQRGDQNVARLTQTSNDNVADVTQDGDGNTLRGASLNNGQAVGVAGSFASQDGYASLTLDQSGTDNVASVGQSGGVAGNSNMVTINQTGSMLDATVLQQGAGNSATVTQSN
jgi:hypothetical protein